MVHKHNRARTRAAHDMKHAPPMKTRNGTRNCSHKCRKIGVEQKKTGEEFIWNEEKDEWQWLKASQDERMQRTKRLNTCDLNVWSKQMLSFSTEHFFFGDHPAKMQPKRLCLTNPGDIWFVFIKLQYYGWKVRKIFPTDTQYNIGINEMGHFMRTLTK